MMERIALIFVLLAGLHLAKQSGWHEGFEAGKQSVLSQIVAEVDRAVARKLAVRQ